MLGFRKKRTNIILYVMGNTIQTIFASFALFAVKKIVHRKVDYELWFINEHEKSIELGKTLDDMLDLVPDQE